MGDWPAETDVALLAALAAADLADGDLVRVRDVSAGVDKSIAHSERKKLWVPQTIEGANAIQDPDGTPVAQYGIPGIWVPTTISTPFALTINTDRYSPWVSMSYITLTSLLFNVTAAPASNANIRVGIYAADDNWQPTGAPLLDQVVAVGSGATGAFTQSISVALPPGRYLTVTNVDVQFSVRFTTGGMGGGWTPDGSATSYNGVFVIARTYASFPNPGSKWTSRTTTAGPAVHGVFFKWTQP